MAQNSLLEPLRVIGAHLLAPGVRLDDVDELRVHRVDGTLPAAAFTKPADCMLSVRASKDRLRPWITIRAPTESSFQLNHSRGARPTWLAPSLRLTEWAWQAFSNAYDCQRDLRVATCLDSEVAVLVALLKRTGEVDPRLDRVVGQLALTLLEVVEILRACEPVVDHVGRGNSRSDHLTHHGWRRCAPPATYYQL